MKLASLFKSLFGLLFGCKILEAHIEMFKEGRSLMVCHQCQKKKKLVSSVTTVGLPCYMEKLELNGGFPITLNKFFAIFQSPPGLIHLLACPLLHRGTEFASTGLNSGISKKF